MFAVVRRIALAVAALVLAGNAHAQDVATVDPTDPVPGAHDRTYLDLVRQFVTDIAATDDGYVGHKVIGMRHINGDEMSGEAPDTVTISTISALPVQSDGKDRLLLLVDFGQAEDSAESFTVLALFSLSDAPELLDEADVGYDRFTGFYGPGRLSLGEGKNLIITTSSHFNSNQNYEATPLILLRNDHFQLVDTVFTFDDNACGYRRNQDLTLREGDRGGRTYSDIVAGVTETVTAINDSCEGENVPKPSQRTIRVRYRWDEAASEFKPDSDAFGRLAKENEERF